MTEPDNDFCVLDLFSGIGSFSLGLERAGMQTVALCEREDYPRLVLAKHWPDVICYDDIRTLTKKRLKADGISHNVMCGGFPCQDISVAGRGAGLDGARSGLWFEYARLIQETKPLWAIIENSPNLRNRGLGTILRFLDAVGYDAWWDGIPACAVGADHERDRLFIVAHFGGVGRRQGREGRPVASDTGQPVSLGALPASDSDGARYAFWQGFRSNIEQELATVKRSNLCAWPQGGGGPGMAGNVYEVAAVLDRPLTRGADRETWRSRVKALGNTLIPDCAEVIGRAIIATTREFSY